MGTDQTVRCNVCGTKTVRVRGLTGGIQVRSCEHCGIRGVGHLYIHWFQEDLTKATGKSQEALVPPPGARTAAVRERQRVINDSHEPQWKKEKPKPPHADWVKFVNECHVKRGEPEQSAEEVYRDMLREGGWES